MSVCACFSLVSPVVDGPSHEEAEVIVNSLIDGVRAMSKMPESLESEVNEAERLINEYRSRISQAIEKERSELRKRAELESAELIMRANKEYTAATEQAQNEAERIVAEANERATRDAERIIAQAEAKVGQLVAETEKRLKKEAKDKAQKEVEQITREARSEAARMMAAARQEAEDASKATLADARREAEQLARTTNEIRQNAELDGEDIRKRAQEESERIMAEARENARKYKEKELAATVVEARQQAEQLLNGARDKAREEQGRLIAQVTVAARSRAEAESAQVVADARKQAQRMVITTRRQLWAELEKTALLALGARESLSRIIAESERQARDEAASEASGISTARLDALAGAGGAEAEEPPQKEEERVYKGRLELIIVPPAHFSQIASLEKLLMQMPKVRLLGKGGSEDGGSWVDVELTEPMPIVTVLKKMTPVQEVVEYANNLIISLKTKQAVS